MNDYFLREKNSFFLVIASVMLLDCELLPPWSFKMEMHQTFMQRDGYELIAALISLALIGVWWIIRNR